MNDPAPVDDARLVKLYLASQGILATPDRRTPLELRWAAEVRDLCLALREARAQLQDHQEPDGS